MAKKIIKIGDSAGVTIPKEDLRALGVRVGSSVETRTSPETGEIIIRVQSKKSPIVNPEVYEVGKRLLERYRSAFEALAQK